MEIPREYLEDLRKKLANVKLEVENSMGQIISRGNDYRQGLLEWVEEHSISKKEFDSEYPNIGKEPLGQGSTSVIYETKDSKVVRVTRAPVEDLAIVNSLNASRVETDILEKLRGSPYIVELFETRIVGLDVYHVMEKAEFGSLDKHIPAEGMSVNRALACMQQIFSGLAYIHSQGIVHYDIKPANILVFKNGQLKLTDFELSLRVRTGPSQDVKIVDDKGDELEEYVFGGSPAFMSPEVIAIKPTTKDIFKTDIFSAGMTFLNLLTAGRHYAKPPLVLLRERLSSDPVREALRIEKVFRGKSCNRCKSLFKYTLQSDPSDRKSAAWIVEHMTKWTLHPRQFGFDDAKSKSIVAQMVRGGMNAQMVRGGMNQKMSLQVWLDKHKITREMFTQRYTLTDTTLFKGGMSEVVKMRDTRDSNNPRALRMSFTRDGDLNNFKNETEIMQTLQGSPYVVKLFETFVLTIKPPAGLHVMELADAGSLLDHIPASGMTSDRALACMQQIFCGLAFVHSRNIIHYDVNPQNILVFGDGRLKLTDFGVSLRVEGDVLRLWNDIRQQWYPYAGTVDYMAPEIHFPVQSTGTRHQYRKISDLKHEDVFKVDIFSAGVMFLELLTHFLGDIVLGSYDKEAYSQALRVEKAHREVMRENNPGKKMGKLCNRCKKLFQYTFRKIHKRKSAAEIVHAMRTWTLHPRQFGFDDAKSKPIVAQMVRETVRSRRGGGESKVENRVQLRL